MTSDTQTGVMVLLIDTHNGDTQTGAMVRRESLLFLLVLHLVVEFAVPLLTERKAFQPYATEQWQMCIHSQKGAY